MSVSAHQKRSRKRPPLAVWLVSGALVFAMAASAALAALAWQESRRVQSLRDQVEGLQDELRTSQAHIDSLQATAATLADRVASLEADDLGQRIADLQLAVEQASDSLDYAELRTVLGEIEAEVATFQTGLDELAIRIDALEPADSAGPSATLPSEVLLDVVPQKQSHNLSCESSASSMVASYHGLSLSEAEVLALLPRSDNPHLGFRGNVDGPTGGIQDYGVYAGPIQAILNQRGLQAVPVEGGLDGVRAAITRGNPVIAWVTYDCLPSTPVAVTVGGAPMTLVPNQHVVVVTGYTEGGIWANDPWDGVKEFYSEADFDRAMAYFGYMALEVAAP